MDKNIYLVNFESKSLRALVEDKLKSLENINSKITTASVFIKEENDYKIVEVSLNVPFGRNVFVKKFVKNVDDFEFVIKDCFSSVRRQLTEKIKEY